MTRYSNDPRQITAKFSSSCSKCKTKIKKGATIYYRPSSLEVFCTNCGNAPYRQFLSSAADEDVYNGTGNPFAWQIKRRGCLKSRDDLFFLSLLTKILIVRYFGNGFNCRLITYVGFFDFSI